MRILAFTSTHDSSVTVIEDGKIIYYNKEERLSRRKREPFPFLCLMEVREKIGNKFDAIFYHRLNNNSFGDNASTGIYVTLNNFFNKFFVYDQFVNFSHLNHHDCHASLAFVNSGFENALVYVADRGGSVFFKDGKEMLYETETLYQYSSKHSIKSRKLLYKNFGYYEKNCNDLSIEEIKKMVLEHFPPDVDTEINFTAKGITYLYSTAAGLISEGIYETGKAMGLSSYGKSEALNLFKAEDFDRNNHNNFRTFKLDDRWFDIPTKIKPINSVTKENFQRFANYCKYVQTITQDVVLNDLRKFIKKTGIKNVCMSGGYANNIVTNAYLKENLLDVNFYFEPVCDDSGVSIGAAYESYLSSDINNTIEPPKDNFFIYYQKEELREPNLIDLSISELLDLFLKQKTIAIFQGQPEAGQRALGNRSIIFDARNPEGKEIVNKTKQREWYRPFAGVIREEDFKEHFYNNGFNESPNMMINFKAKDITIKNYPSVIHVDSTCRIQTVSEGFLYDFITLLKDKTNSTIILNTSFNLAGLPLVHTVENAVRTFNSSKIDVLYFVDDKKALIKK